MGEIAGANRTDGWFGPADVGALFEAFRLEAPRNIPQDLARMRKSGHITARTTQPSWTLSPEGRQEVRRLVGHIDIPALMSEIAATPGAQLGHVHHALIPPVFAPAKWQPPITRMLRDFDFDTNVFCMTRFPESSSDGNYLDPVAEIVPVAREVLSNHGLTLHLASDRQLDDDLYGNIAAHMWACRYGVALIENRAGRGLNENMIIEVGSMLMTGRRSALLKDCTIGSMPTDFVGHIFKPVDFAEIDQVAEALHSWVADDLGLES